MTKQIAYPVNRDQRFNHSYVYIKERYRIKRQKENRHSSDNCSTN